MKLIDLLKLGVSQWGEKPENFTDKEALSGHQYASFYEYILSTKKEKVKMLEIGIRSGGSLWLWKNYFQSYEIHGLEIAETFYEQRPFQKEVLEDSNVHIHWNFDSKNSSNYLKLPDNFDFIIDDGDHSLEGQMLTFRQAYPKLASKGVYFVEDVQGLDKIIPLIDSIKSVDNTAIVNVYIGKIYHKYDDIIVWVCKS